MANWQDYDFDRTIRDFEYTRRAAAGLNQVIESDQFADMDADLIFRYLSDEMEVVLFPDYLKRFIYMKLGISQPFSEVPDETYLRIISDSLEENHAPYSLTPTTTKKSAMIRLWLTQPNVRRSVIFVLGFGLRMSDTEVTEFLTKVIKEEDFDFRDPTETIYWYCYHNDLPYAAFLEWKRRYAELDSSLISEQKWHAMQENPKPFLLSEQNLFSYLSALKDRNITTRKDAQVYEEFVSLYERCREIIANIYSADAENKHWSAEDIKPADLEKVLCSGIPVNGSANLSSMSASRFAALFRNRRMSRQRISSILKGTHAIERFDLISLLFYIYAETIEPDWPTERYLQFIDEANAMLVRCGMAGISPSNPYEAFVLMCLVSDDPLDVYAQVWEKSYGYLHFV